MFMDAVCHAVPRRARSLPLRSRFVVSRSAGRRASLKPPFYGPRYGLGTTVAVASWRSPRGTTSRARPRLASVVGHCYMHGPAHPGSSRRPSPWLRPSATVSRPEAPFWRCTRPAGGPTTTTNGNVSHLKERLCPARSLGVEASRAVPETPQRTTQRARTLWASGKTLASAYTTSQ